MLNHILYPLNSPPLPSFCCSGLGLILEHDGGWRTSSTPFGNSINNFIDLDVYTLTYCTVDDAYAIVNLLHPGILLSKINLKMHFISRQFNHRM